MSAAQTYQQASVKTADNLRTLAHSTDLSQLSRLSLPEIDKLVDRVAQVIPAGNVPGVILSGLSRLPDRRPPLKTLKRDIGLLFKGIEQTLDKAVYSAFFAGPAAVIWGYQNLLKLAGKDPEAAFPDGTWQFYVEYALRDDTARHANETHGFDTTIASHHLRLTPADRITAWLMATFHTLHSYDALLENEWRERVYCSLLSDITRDTPDAPRTAKLYREWEGRRPYARGADATADQDYAAYRRAKFEAFLAPTLAALPVHLLNAWRERVRLTEATDLPAYQRQLSILAYLEPDAYGETRQPIPVSDLHVGVIYQGRYYLLPVCAPNTTRPLDVATVRAQVAQWLAAPSGHPVVSLLPLATLRRPALAQWRSKINRDLLGAWDALRTTPILLNADARPRHLPLAEIRQAERGLGDHALTIFDTGSSFVFDQSHIFFDGAWGAALAETLTTEALSWAVYLSQQPPAPPAGERLYRPLPIHLQASELDALQAAPRVTPEVSIETEAINLKALLNLRKLFKLRSDLLQLTVNDVLVLYRAIHAVTYHPAEALIAELRALANGAEPGRSAALMALEAVGEAGRSNPAILIPLDASLIQPRERLYPLSFEAPLQDLDLLTLHARSLEALAAYQSTTGDRAALYTAFDQTQKNYLAALAGFGALMNRVKEIATVGESASVGAIKMLAHLPLPLQRLLDSVPGRFDVLNDLIKGREVFSNVGVVAATSTLTRFITAKDDNDKKTLAWGVITDARGVLRLSLRDFRPHVGALIAANQHELAARLARDYVEAYARGLNDYVRDVRRITVASRETKLPEGEQAELAHLPKIG